MRVSPYMLYALARRYDEFAGDADEGSSLRGALKGWYYHGVLPDGSLAGARPGPGTGHRTIAALAALCDGRAARRLLPGQRLPARRHAVGGQRAARDRRVRRRSTRAGADRRWSRASRRRRTEQLAVISGHRAPRRSAGHAFAIVGYNDVGFLVQNSWGPTWGRGGFATLTYDDWLDSAYDAWVARPGVRSVVSQRTHQQTLTATAGEVASAPGPGPSAAATGTWSTSATTGGCRPRAGSPALPRRSIACSPSMADYHDHWAASPLNGDPAPRRIVLYAHGGLDSEATGLSIA